MNRFSHPAIQIAGQADIPFLVHLLNSAYRGESSRKGWTTEADLIAGNVRTDEKNVREVMDLEGSVFLKYTDTDGSLLGCVNLQQHGSKVYLGMFSVRPENQGGGIGKAILQAAEEWTLSRGCTVIYMFVISVRDELISWYARHGYRDTGERKFFREDGLTGKHLRPLEFLTMEKMLEKTEQA